MKKLTLCIGMLLASVLGVASAAVQEAEPPPPAPQQCDLHFGTGPAGKGYSKFFANIKAVCPQVPVCEKTSEGGLDNLNLLATKEADVALTGVNTLQTMLGTDEQLKQLQVVASLHSNLLHTVTLANGFSFKEADTVKESWGGFKKETIPGAIRRVEINKFSDLKGQSVGVVGSAQLLARKLNGQAGHGMQFVDFNDDKSAFEALKAQQVVAVLTMAAWPHGVIDKMKPAEGLKLVDYDLQPSTPFNVIKRNYKGLGQFGVQFLAEPNILVTRPFLVSGENAQNVAKLKSCITANLGKFKDGKFEPGWSEVSDLNQTYNLPVFSAGTPNKKK